MILASITVTLAVLALLAAYDPWFALFLKICLDSIVLEVRKLPLKLKLEWEIYWCKRSMKKYLRMADEIIKERAAADQVNS
ncbi:hypothetical protein S-CBP42_0054 [Synechococcus phage S-CBP42]|uniref:Uncharacterized protein n=1 Tax=Synechococcus phage S-CBP42 TaxID=461711 RepID=A0A096VKW4_9CAUD|nr:hypothetical protein AVU76_gp54 [Synechococcus phage S-CBP42]AGK86704.1 hypothetical protein S-CBP42_0054 [Synechococcus phage S-CBP42]